MPKRPRGDFEPGHVSVREAVELAAIGKIGVQVFVLEPADFVETGVLGHDSVALAQDQIIAVGIARPAGSNAQMLAIENCQDLHQRKCAADVSRLPPMGKPENRPPQSARIECSPFGCG